MRFYRNSASGRTRTIVERALAYVLFVGIVYSATFGAVHSHGDDPTTLYPHQLAATQQAGSLSELPFQTDSSEHDCLICVLHRQFSSSIVHAPVFLVGPSTDIAVVSAPTIFTYTGAVISRPTTRLSGRAPPVH